MKAKRICPICESKEVDFLHAQKFELPEDHPLTAGYDVVSCSACGFVYADTEATQADYDRFYARYSKYEDAKTGTGGIENPFDWKRQQETARYIAETLNDRTLSVLDVGCANGGMLKALKELGFENLCGIDPSPVCVENTRRVGADAHQGSLFQPFKENAYDCVILSHTLEHVQDVRGAMNWIAKRLKPNGVVYVETPDAKRYLDFLYAPLQDFNTEHINHFSLTSLRNLIERGDFIFIEGASKDLPLNDKMDYPAVYGFWKLAKNTKTYFSKDDVLRQKINEYIARSKEMIQRIDRQIANLISSNTPLIVWCAGQLTLKLLAETSLGRADIVAFVDNNPINHQKNLHGKPILPPAKISQLDEPILIATLLHHQSIAKQIRDMGLTNEIILLQGSLT